MLEELEARVKLLAKLLGGRLVMNGNFAELELEDGTRIDEFNADEYAIKLVKKNN